MSFCTGREVSFCYVYVLDDERGRAGRESRKTGSGNANLEICAVVVTVFVDDHESDGPVHEVLSIAELYYC